MRNLLALPLFLALFLVTAVQTTTVWAQAISYGTSVYGQTIYTQLPPEPPIITGVKIEAGQATILFDAPSDTNSGLITEYILTANPGGITVSCQKSPCIVTGLQRTLTYSFSMLAVNSAGQKSKASIAMSDLTSQTERPKEVPMLSTYALLLLAIAICLWAFIHPRPKKKQPEKQHPFSHLEHQ